MVALCFFVIDLERRASLFEIEKNRLIFSTEDQQMNIRLLFRLRTILQSLESNIFRMQFEFLFISSMA